MMVERDQRAYGRHRFVLLATLLTADEAGALAALHADDGWRSYPGTKACSLSQ